jgi:hypothetical protein
MSGPTLNADGKFDLTTRIIAYESRLAKALIDAGKINAKN